MVGKKNNVYKKLKFEIVTNVIGPGDALNEKKLMAEYHIGRTPLREIFILLQNEGLIEMIPKLGTFVSKIEMQEIKDSIEIRRELEGLVGILAVERIFEDQLINLKKIVAEMQNLQNQGSKSLKTWGTLDGEFHDILYEATQNQKLKITIKNLHSTVVRFWYHLGMGWEVFSGALDDFTKVIEALENKNKIMTRKAMINHIDRFVKNMREKVF